MKPEWITPILVLVGMAASVFLAVDKWVHGRDTSDSELARDVRDLQRTLQNGEYGRRIGEIREQVARMEQHLISTDREVLALMNNVEALRNWISTMNKHT